MRLFIPSRGRYTRQFIENNHSPLAWLTPTLAEKTFYVVRDDEFKKYKRALEDYGVRVLNCGDAPNLGAKREFIAQHVMELGDKQFMMCDDDVALTVRYAPEDWHLRHPTVEEVEYLFLQITKYLSNYAMVGVSAREGNNRAGVGKFPLITECTRSMRMYAFNIKDYKSIRANRLKEMADFDTVLQLLRKGRKNAVINYYAQAQPSSQSEGGCSIYRTAETHDKVCRQLQGLHPDFVKLRQKQNKGDQRGFGTRTEVTVQWKKAYESSQVPWETNNE